MAVKYACPRCGMALGTIEAEVPEWRLGFHFLTPEERASIITYEPNGDVVVHVICEYCQEAVLQHPEWLLMNSHLQ
ncbi:MAG: DUF2757 family protein [Bacillota bacterium]